MVSIEGLKKMERSPFFFFFSFVCVFGSYSLQVLVWQLIRLWILHYVLVPLFGIFLAFRCILKNWRLPNFNELYIKQWRSRSQRAHAQMGRVGWLLTRGVHCHLYSLVSIAIWWVSCSPLSFVLCSFLTFWTKIMMVLLCVITFLYTLFLTRSIPTFIPLRKRSMYCHL